MMLKCIIYVGLELLIPIILWQEHEVRDEL